MNHCNISSRVVWMVAEKEHLKCYLRSCRDIQLRRDSLGRYLLLSVVLSFYQIHILFTIACESSILCIDHMRFSKSYSLQVFSSYSLESKDDR